MTTENKLAILVCLFSFLVKLIILENIGIQYFADGNAYASIAKDIYKNNFFFPDTYLTDAPGLPYFFSLFESFRSIISIDPYVFGNVLVSSLSVYVFYLITFKIYKKKDIALFAALLAAIYPFFIFYSLTWLSETLYIFFLYISVYFYLLFLERKRIVYLILFSMFFAIDTLVRFVNFPMFFVFIFLTIYILIKENFFASKIFQIVSICLLSYFLVLTPWLIRNYNVYETIVFTDSGSFGKVFFSGNNSFNKSGGGIGGIDVRYEDLKRFENIQNLSLREETMIGESIQWIKSNPIDWIQLEIKKLVRFFSPIFYAERFNKLGYNLISFSTYGVILVAFVISFRKNFKYHFYETSPMLIYSLMLLGIHLITISSIRYRLPIEPMMIIMSSPIIFLFLKRIIK